MGKTKELREFHGQLCITKSINIKKHTTKNVARSGRPRKTTQKDGGYILRKFKQNILQTPRSVAKKLKDGAEIDISERTVRRRLKDVFSRTFF